MFDNPGDKMKIIAKVNFVIGLIVSVVLAIVFISKGNDLNSVRATKGSGDILIWSGIVVGVLGIVVSLTISFTLATLGSINDIVDSIAYLARKREHEGEWVAPWVCDNCGTLNKRHVIHCTVCHNKKSYEKETPESIGRRDQYVSGNSGMSNFRQSALGYGTSGKNDIWRCKNCGEENAATSVFCASCGEHK